MSFKITKLTIGKGRTQGDEKAGKWTRQYYELETTIEDEAQIELAKGSVETLLDAWLNGETISATNANQSKPSESKDRTALPYRIDAIPWTDKENEKGKYQICSDESNADFMALRAFLLKHAGGRISTRDNQGVLWFCWLFQDSKTVGRKISQFKKKS